MSAAFENNEVLRRADGLGAWIEKISGLVSAILLILMTLVANLGIVFRYVMNQAFEWTEEVSIFCMLIVVFLSINTAFRRNEHIAITSFAGSLPGPYKKLLSYLCLLLVAFFLVMLMIQGYGMASRTLMTAGTIPVSMRWIYLFVPVGALLTMIQLVLKVIILLSKDLGWVTRKEPPQVVR
jgi:TRAP-type C4-dicarboxylate transport system permease small subunit